MIFAFFLKGIVVGIVIAVPVGPVGILCMRRTIFDGRLAGLVSGLGAATADACFGIIAGFGLTVVSDWLLGYQDWLRLAGAGFLFYVGGSALFAEPPLGAPPPSRESLLRDYASSFALTLSNPVTLLAFFAIFTGIGLAGEQATLDRAGLLVAGVWIGSFLWWLALSLGAGSFLVGTFDRKHLKWINRGSGGILLLSGAALLGTLAFAHLR
jgi:threonine/homoserine/homoserine lactone efflux protein